MPSDRLAIVTGTTSGIGRVVARLLVERQWVVVGIARRAAPFESQAYHHVQFDLATVDAESPALADRLAPHLAAATARVGLVNNGAAIGLLGSIVDAAPADVARVLRVNVAAPLWLMSEVVRRAPPAAALRIVNVSSGAATGAYPGIGVYSVSKAALRMAGMSLASEWNARETTQHRRGDAAILSYEPGIVDTDMQTTARGQSRENFPWPMFRAFHKEGALVSPERPAAEIVAFLESKFERHFSERRLPG